MALSSSLVRSVSRLARRSLFTTTTRLNKTDDEDYPDFPDPLEHMTGMQKRIILAELAGNPDPFNCFARKKSPNSTRDKPNEVPSAYESRIIGCICDEDQAHIKWMWVHKGDPARCSCGAWYKLVYAPPV